MSSAESKTEPGRAPGSTVAGLVIAAALAILAVVIGTDASMLNTKVASDPLGPAAFSYAIAAGLLVLAVATVLSALRGKTPAPEEKQDAGAIAWVIAGLLAQIGLIAVNAGFSLASGLLFGFAARGFGKPLWLGCLVGVVLSFLVWLAFAQLLQLSLPQGPLEHAVTTLLSD
ncbi:tripartite tricarboxylate transporter TctB family protein [Labrys sp. LIt4]|uniref:Tripartite tricarboxylate transporter TctB family protein n=1 Tax=Labrys okinawensis TaxID=346911 RepID=A0A2S9QHY1_9HYPH|nr:MULTISPECIES: tripartite tricarboxylate transporter TctB family protein [Labrys]MBP0582459.1 tripartite tricarboxylate transporter TctB family protein [Labrys sp. LIt4]PRH88945.1 tripartite tricarboxylate transporter TctB family protein [Labrys okinawensis]